MSGVRSPSPADTRQQTNTPARETTIFCVPTPRGPRVAELTRSPRQNPSRRRRHCTIAVIVGVLPATASSPPRPAHSGTFCECALARKRCKKMQRRRHCGRLDRWQPRGRESAPYAPFPARRDALSACSVQAHGTTIVAPFASVRWLAKGAKRCSVVATVAAWIGGSREGARALHMHLFQLVATLCRRAPCKHTDHSGTDCECALARKRCKKMQRRRQSGRLDQWQPRGRESAPIAPFCPARRDALSACSVQAQGRQLRVCAGLQKMQKDAASSPAQPLEPASTARARRHSMCTFPGAHTRAFAAAQEAHKSRRHQTYKYELRELRDVAHVWPLLFTITRARGQGW